MDSNRLTALGLNNYGVQVYRYGLEDTDVDDNGEEVFRESDSGFFCRLRDVFSNELKSMYNTLESKNAWHAESFLNQIDEWQGAFPEELWRLDIERKYIRTYNSSFINGAGDAQFLINMANGKMKYTIKQWERSQEKYMASKYQSSAASSDNAVLRCTVPLNPVVPVNYKLKLIPYAYMYLNVKYGTASPIQLRAKPNVEYEIPFEGSSTDIIDIYSASLIQSFGDLSTCYPATVDTSKAEKIKQLIIGNGTEGYDNPSFTTLTTGANNLLEKLNVENVSGLTQSLNLSALSNLKELYAHGSNIGGVTFANGGKIEIAEIPAVGALSMRNLEYLHNLDIISFEHLTTAVIENCNNIDVRNIIESAAKLNRIRISGIDWTLDDTTLLESLYAMSGLDKNGYNVPQSVVMGKVHVPIIRQQQLYNYRTAWSDLEITFDTMIEQFTVTFVNDDNTVLDVQYVDKGSSAVDPITREDNPIATPTKESSVEYDYTFSKWDTAFTGIFADRTIKATYTHTLREYTVKYVAKGITLQESNGLYGSNVSYTGTEPTYTLEESGYVYHLFNRWDKSGFVDGDKTINAIFDRFEYSEGAFDGKELTDLSPVEIYAMNKLNLASTVITDKDSYSITIGNDINYDDITSKLLISEPAIFDGSNYLDTEIKLFDEDRDFTLAIDYEFAMGNKANSVLAQCFQSNGTNGFKLWYGSGNGFSGVRLTWGTVTDNVVAANRREIIVISHRKGDNNLKIFKSNLEGNDVITATLERTKTTVNDSTLVFGCSKADDGMYENHAKGSIYWAKLWYADLGDDICESLAIWTHEQLDFEACGFRKYYLANEPSKRCSFSLLATNLLSSTAKWNNTNTNDGGWAKSALNKSLNSRLYKAMPQQFRTLMKEVKVYSSIGKMSDELDSSNCFITIPALVEVDPTQTSEPYNSEGTAISYMTTNDSRKRAFKDGDYAAYWLRSPNTGYSTYVWRVDEYGQTQGITMATNELGVLIEISL